MNLSLKNFNFPLKNNLVYSRPISTIPLNYDMLNVMFEKTVATHESLFLRHKAQSNDKFLVAEQLSIRYFPTQFIHINYSPTGSIILSVKLRFLHSFLHFLKHSWFFRYTELLDIICVDLPSRRNRYSLTYVVLSIKHQSRIYVRVYTDGASSVPSIFNIFNSANWLEREIWDMFGVPFSGHPDLRRILTDYGFFGHPLKKDFPLTGFFEIRYDDTSRRIVSESLNLIQELRLFFLNTAWKKW